MKKRVNIFYSGAVQGVGFRYTAERIANRFGLSGWVRNLRDGRVEVVAEGPENNLKEFLKQIEVHFGNYIRNKKTDWSEATGEFTGFGINFI